MKFRAIPRSDLIVSEVGLRWREAVWRSRRADDLSVERLLRQAYDHGIAFFDLGTFSDAAALRFREALAPIRSNVLIAASPDVAATAERESLTSACRRTVRRLGLERLDLLMLPGRRNDDESAERLEEELRELAASGLTRSTGLRLEADATPLSVREIIDRLPVAFLETDYGLLSQASNRSFLPALEHRAESRRVGFAAAAPLLNPVLPAAEAFSFLWTGGGRTATQAAIQFALAKPAVSTVLLDVDDTLDLAEIAAATVAAPLTAEEVEAAERIWNNAPAREAAPTPAEFALRSA